MKKLNIQVLLLILMTFFLVSCSQNSNDDIKGNTVTVYFYNTTQEKLVAESVVTEKNLQQATEEEMIVAVINALSKGPLVAPVPINFQMPVKDFKIDDKVVSILFSDEYSKLSTSDQIVTRVSLLYSLTELDFVDGVMFYVGDSEIVNGSGEPIGVLNRRSILTGAIDPKPPTNIKLITLYFAKQNSDKLYKETREVHINDTTPLEKYIVEELIKGPRSNDLIATIPKGTKIDVKTESGVCQVDFSAEIKSKQFSSTKSKELLLYSIVNSLTELDNIQKVIFLVDGKKQSEFTTDIDLSESFERNEEIIE
jgi:germination protein M